MIKNEKKFRKFEDNFNKKQRIKVKQAFKIVEGLYTEARQLGSFNKHNLLQGLGVVIKMAKAVNHVPKTA